MNNFWTFDFLKNALLEDVGRGDLYSNIATPKTVKAEIIAKSNGIFSGEIFLASLNKMFDAIQIEIIKKDKDTIASKDIIATITGESNTILMIERVLLNTIQHSSGIATNVHNFYSLIKDKNLALLDTRKTRPLLREFEKYSSRNGGAINHRMGLDDCLMLKDTHLKAIDNLKEFIANARAKIPWTSKIEIECESYEDAKKAIDLGIEIIMCDNMNIEEIKRVIEYKNKANKQVKIEASGNITTANISNYEFIGLDAISSGSLIHQATWLDFSMKIK